MSDKSDYSDSGSDQEQYHSETDLDHEYDDGDQDSQEDGEIESQDEEPKKDTKVVDLSQLTLCASHKSGHMTHECKSCAGALSLINDPGVVKSLTANAVTSSLVSLYSGRCDEVVPTLDLKAETVELARNVFTKGQFRDRKSWNEVVKNYLTLPTAQHDQLNADIKSEDVLNKFKKQKRFRNIFKYHQDMVDCMRNLRVAQRPILSLIEKTNDGFAAIKKLGVDAGVAFTDNPPLRQSEIVPTEGRKVPDRLNVESYADLFPRHDMGQLIKDAKLSDDQAKAVADFIEQYRTDVGTNYIDLFSGVSSMLADSEDLLIFYTNLYSHVDGQMRELVRDRVASLFRSDIKNDVLNKTKPKELNEKPSGLFGGKISYYFPLSKPKIFNYFR